MKKTPVTKAARLSKGKDTTLNRSSKKLEKSESEDFSEDDEDDDEDDDEEEGDGWFSLFFLFFSSQNLFE